MPLFVVPSRLIRPRLAPTLAAPPCVAVIVEPPSSSAVLANVCKSVVPVKPSSDSVPPRSVSGEAGAITPLAGAVTVVKSSSSVPAPAVVMPVKVFPVVPPRSVSVPAPAFVRPAVVELPKALAYTTVVALETTSTVRLPPAVSVSPALRSVVTPGL